MDGQGGDLLIDGREVVVNSLNGFLSARGFSRRGSMWYRTSEDVLTVVTLQRSRFGPAFYVNVGLWLMALGDATHPKENQCHVRTRLELLVGDDRPELEALLNFGDPSYDTNRADALEYLLDRYLGPVLDSAVNTATLRSPVGEPLLRSALVYDDAAELLGLGPSV